MLCSACAIGQTSFTQISAAPNPVASIRVAGASTVFVGSTLQFSATTVLQDGSASVPACSLANGLNGAWSSSTPSVATINAATGLASGVAGGSTTISCADGGLVGSVNLTVVAIPAIISPTCGTQPCPLTGTVNGAAYSYTLIASGGLLPYVWSCPATCTMPGWMSLNSSTGVLSGTAATGTSTFTIKVTDNTPVFTTLAVTLTVAASSTCNPPNYAGPPVYPCGSNSSANPGQINYLFQSGAPSGFVNTSNAAIAPCTSNCMQLASTPVYNFLNLDDTNAGWNTCNGCAGGTGTATNVIRTINNASPSLDGNAMFLSVTGPTLTGGQTTNQLWYEKVGPNNSLTTFTGTYNVNFPSLSNVASAEYDQFLFDQGTRYMQGSQCLIGGVWQIWNSCGGSWLNASPSVSCGLTANAYHSIVWNTHIDPPSSTSCGGHPCEYYDSLIFDGVSHGPFAAQPACASSDLDNVGIQVQIDITAAGGTATEYVDSMSLIASATPVLANDAFSTGWNVGNGAGNGGNIQLGGGSGTATTTNGAVGSCPADCVTWVSGNVFNSSWTKINLAGVSYTVGVFYNPTLLSVTHAPGAQPAVGYSVVGTPYGVSAWNSSTVATLMSAPGTQTGATYFNQTACKPGTALVSGNGCQNSISEDTTIPGHVAGSNLITRGDDGSVTQYGKSIGNLTVSGGDADHDFSYPNGTYFWAALSGGVLQPFQLTTASHAVQVVNSGCVPPALNPGGAFSTGWLSDTRYYYFIGTAIQQADLTGSGCALALGTPTALVDLMGAGVCPGLPVFTVGSRSSFAVSANDDTFTIGLAPNGQGSGDWIVTWSRTKGCSTANFSTGQAWAFCTSSCTTSTPPLGTMATGASNCWGSSGSTGKGWHDIIGDGAGQFIVITPTGPWTQGGCVGLTGSAAGLTVWQIGTLGNQYCANSGVSNINCGDHANAGINRLATPSFLGWNYRTLTAVSSFNTFTASFLPYQDIHFSWPHNDNGVYDDLLPLIGNTDQVAVASLAGCSGSGAFNSAIYCPTYFNNVTVLAFPYATYPPGQTLVFSHTGAGGFTGTAYAQTADQIPDSFGSGASIAVISPKGDILAFTSSMWHQTGLDNIGMPRAGLYFLYLGHP